MGEGLIKAIPEPNSLPRQSSESYILVNTRFDLELRHFKAMLFLGSIKDLDLGISENAQAAVRALNQASDLLSMAIVEWYWLDRHGVPYEVEPENNSVAFEPLSMDEVNWMLEAVSALLKEEAVPGGN